MWELSMNPVDGKPNPEKLLELQYDLRKNRFKSKIRKYLQNFRGKVPKNEYTISSVQGN